MEPLNNIDVVILIGVAISMLIAFIRGFVREVLSVIGLALFIILVLYASPFLTDWFKPYIQSLMLTKTIVFLLLMAVFYGLWIVGTDKLIARIRTSSLSLMDRLFGLLFGFLRAVIILSFCFLLVKLLLPEELKDGSFKKSKYFMMAEGCSDLLESFIPEEKIKETLKSVEDVNKVEKDKDAKKDGNENKKNSDKKIEEKEAKEEVKLPSKQDQEQMNKMFDLLVKPEIKKIAKNAEEKTGYSKKETEGLDDLINETIE